MPFSATSTWDETFENIIREQITVEDASHDMAHFRRVLANARKIATLEMNQTSTSAFSEHTEGKAYETARVNASTNTDTTPAAEHKRNDAQPKSINPDVLTAACYFHDIVSLPKHHPDRSRSSVLAANRAIELLKAFCPSFPSALYGQIKHAIEAHSFSANIETKTLEACIVQDADRLESLGAIGLARVFYIGGKLNHDLFNAEDPLAQQRPLKDMHYVLDHFQTKLLTLPDTMKTASGKKLARQQAHYMIEYVGKLVAELNGDIEGKDLSAMELLEKKFNC